MGNGRNGQDLPPSVPASLLTRVQALPGVAAATGGVGDRAHLVGHNGKTISRGGAPGLAFSYDPAGERFNPLTLTKGTWPASANQIAIDSSTASKDHFSVGDQIGVVALGPVERFKIVGTVKIAGVSSLGGSTMSVFTLPTAQRLFNKQGKFDEIDVAAKPGTSRRRRSSSRSGRCCRPQGRSGPVRRRRRSRPRTPAASSPSSSRSCSRSAGSRCSSAAS